MEQTPCGLPSVLGILKTLSYFLNSTVESLGSGIAADAEVAADLFEVEAVEMHTHYATVGFVQLVYQLEQVMVVDTRQHIIVGCNQIQIVRQGVGGTILLIA